MLRIEASLIETLAQLELLSMQIDRPPPDIW
jgi:hypothetical protein